MSIVRVGLAETKNFAEGYEAIFGKKKDQEEAKKEEAASAEEAKKEETKK
jgi:hypothetical protein